MVDWAATAGALPNVTLNLSLYIEILTRYQYERRYVTPGTSVYPGLINQAFALYVELLSCIAQWVPLMESDAGPCVQDSLLLNVSGVQPLGGTDPSNPSERIN